MDKAAIVTLLAPLMNNDDKKSKLTPVGVSMVRAAENAVKSK